jgi:hypothetical protein
MGGQTLYPNGIAVDMTPFNQMHYRRQGRADRLAALPQPSSGLARTIFRSSVGNDYGKHLRFKLLRRFMIQAFLILDVYLSCHARCF